MEKEIFYKIFYQIEGSKNKLELINIIESHKPLVDLNLLNINQKKRLFNHSIDRLEFLNKLILN